MCQFVELWDILSTCSLYLAVPRVCLAQGVQEMWFCLCEIHKPNYHNQSRQQPPHKQTRKHELAL